MDLHSQNKFGRTNTIFSSPPLQPVKEAPPQQVPCFLQQTPRKLRYPSFYNLLTLTCDQRGIHALFTAHSQVDYVLFNLNTSEFSQNGPFGELNSQYLLKQGMPLRLVTINSNLGVVIDQHGGMFPISKNSAGNLRDLQLMVSLCAEVVSIRRSPEFTFTRHTEPSSCCDCGCWCVQ